MEESATPLLPILNEAELNAIFRNDERAIWRYNILAALLLDGQSTRDVAQSFGTTVETVRTLRTSFLATGHLDTLRSKRRGAAGHLSRQTPLAQAVARELTADPTASGGAIWRRVQERLGDRGVQVPRRSVYRIIERLRPTTAEPEQPAPTNDLWAPALVPALRTALPLLRLEPPLDLGRSELAGQLFAQEPDPLVRGENLRQLIQRSLEQMRPTPDIDPQDPAYRPYQVLVGEALRGLSRDELQRELAIATATYTRAKRQGLDQLAELLVQGLQHEQHTRVRAPAPVAPPLLGREALVRYYSQRLQDEHIAVIWGLAGCGKTAIAATLAASYQSDGELVTWHQCSGSGDDLLRALLGSLGMTELGPSLDTEELLDVLRDQLRAGGLLVLDAYDRIADDQIGGLLIALLLGLAGQGALTLIVVSRTLPGWAQHQGWLPLGGIAEDMARALWTISGGPMVEAADWQTIYNRTLGYPQLLQLLATTPSATLEQFLLEQVAAGLSEQARQMFYRTLLAHRPLNIYAKGDASADPITQKPYAELVQRGLLIRQGDRGIYHLHGLLRASRDELIALLPDVALHYRALAAQASAAHEWLDAALYFSAAGDAIPAMRLIGAHVDELVGQQRGQAALDVLRTLLRQLPPGPELAEIQAHVGAIYLALGCYREALDALSAALDLTVAFRASLPALEVRRWHRLSATANLRLGQWDRALSHAQISMGSERAITAEVAAHERMMLTLLQYRVWQLGGHKDQAQYWLADAQMQVRVTACPHSAALIALAEGLTAMRQGAFATAEQRLRTALEQLPEHEYQTERFEAAAQLARCLTGQGQLDAARDLARAFWSAAQAMRHSSGTVELALALVHVLMCAGAIENAWAVLGLAEDLLDPTNQLLEAELLLAKGWLTLNTPDGWSSQQHFSDAIAVASRPAIPEIQAEANLGLAVLYLQQGDATTAAQFAQRAAQLAEAAGLERIKAVAYLCLGREAILRHAFSEAEALLTKIYNDGSDLLVAGNSQRLIAELYAANGATDEAEKAFRQSLETLRNAPMLARSWAEQSYSSFAALYQPSTVPAPPLTGGRQKQRGSTGEVGLSPKPAPPRR
jgi:tetratricopeptide (TPR) repeat protein/transposase